MKQIIAIPMENGVLCQHFGHCENFYFASVDGKNIEKEWVVTPPAHEPGLYPAWVKGKGADTVIAGGMGKKACDLFNENNITIHTGAQSLEPHKIVKEFLDNSIEYSKNACENHVHSCE